MSKTNNSPITQGGGYDVFIWEFPNFQKAIECHESKEYQDGWSLAKDTTERNLQIVEGFSTE